MLIAAETQTPIPSARTVPIAAPPTAYATPTLDANTRARLTPAAAALWRVVDARGRVIGHLQIVEHDLGLRYRARRFHSASGRFRDIGDFWSADDAVGCLHHAL